MRVCLGAFAGAHGVKGESVVKTFTAAPENIAAYGPVRTEDGTRILTLEFVRETKPGLALVRAPEITSREDAQSLKGVRFYVDRIALPDTEEDEFYVDDLVGVSAVDEAGAPAGLVAAVHNFGAGDILELTDIPGVKGARMVPFSKAAVPEVNLALAQITVVRNVLENQGELIVGDETGEIVSNDIALDLAAMREEDA
jgi:16S rRNA processing protein RimM